MAEDVGLVSLGPAQPAHPPSLLAPALRALAERLQRGPAAERGQASPRRAREPRARGKRATKGPGRSGRGLGRSTPPPAARHCAPQPPAAPILPAGGKVCVRFSVDGLSLASGCSRMHVYYSSNCKPADCFHECTIPCQLLFFWEKKGAAVFKKCPAVSGGVLVRRRSTRGQAHCASACTVCARRGENERR